MDGLGYSLSNEHETYSAVASTSASAGPTPYAACHIGRSSAANLVRRPAMPTLSGRR
jgi:hypothetical protein